MLNFYRLAIAIVVAMLLPSSLYGQTETLKFAWPDGASAKVQVRSHGKQVIDGKADPWDMSLDFTMQVKRSNDRIVVSRNDYSGWKGTLADPLGAGVEQFVDMVPTLILREDGAFVGIEGHETARKLMTQIVEQSGGLDQMQRRLFESTLSDASLEAMSRQHWAGMAIVWRHVELDPNASYALRSMADIPQLGGELEITGTVRFIKETPCESPRNDLRCIHLHSKTGGDKAQARKLIEALLEREKSKPVNITDWDQHINIEIVVEKQTMLPHYLKISRFHSLTVNDKRSGQNHTSSGDYSTTYTFTWLVTPGTDSPRTADTAKSSTPDFSHVTSKEAVMKLASEGKLVKMLLMPAELGGADRAENVVYVPPGVLENQKEITEEIIGLIKEGLNVKLSVLPEYKGNSFVPAKIHIKTSHTEKRGNLAGTIEIW